VPGHAVGHLSALARTTPDTFIMLGGDACHFVGLFRPSESMPLPDPIPEATPLDSSFPNPCPCSLFTSCHPKAMEGDEEAAKATPWYRVTDKEQSAYVDREVAKTSLKRLEEFDQSPDVLVCMAHDPVLLEVLPLFNNDPKVDLNDWKTKGLKEKCHWGFLNELPRNGMPGRRPIVDGVIKEGKRVKNEDL